MYNFSEVTSGFPRKERRAKKNATEKPAKPKQSPNKKQIKDRNIDLSPNWPKNVILKSKSYTPVVTNYTDVKPVVNKKVISVKENKQNCDSNELMTKKAMRLK